MSNEDNNACLVCREECLYYGIGECNHTVCAKCAIRLKVICKVSDCPICRHKSSRVLITKSHNRFNNFHMDQFLSLPDEDLLFENQEVLEYYTKLNSYTCSECSMECNSMSALKRHVNNDHKKNFCRICIEHLKLFPREHELFDTLGLSEHKRWSPDKPNHGHPKCQICDEWFYDAEMWYNHLRRQHFMCHICENLPTLERFHQQRTVYGNYEQLNKHFIACHFVCHEGSCQSDQFTNVFATENDLRAHRISHHSGAMDKALLRETRRLNIDIRYQRGSAGATGGTGGPNNTSGVGGGSSTGAAGSGVPHFPTAREALDQLVALAPGVREFAANALAASAAEAAARGANGYAENPAEFPTLTGETRPSFAGRQGNKTDAEDFPSLPTAGAAASTAAPSAAGVPPPVYSGPRRVPAPAAYTSLVAAKSSASRDQKEEDYPSLGKAQAASAGTAANSVWGSAAVSAPHSGSEKIKKSGHAAAATPLSGAADFPSLPKPQGPPPTASTVVVAKPVAKPRTYVANATKQKHTVDHPKQPSEPPLPPDPVEFRPPGLRYQLAGGASISLQPDEPTVYKPFNSISCVPAAPPPPQPQPSTGSIGQQNKSKQSNFILAEDFPGLPQRPAQSSSSSSSSKDKIKDKSTKNRFAALTDQDSVPVDIEDGEDWTAWPAGSSEGSQRPAASVASAAAAAAFAGRVEDFPSLGPGSNSKPTTAAPTWHKDGRSNLQQQQQQQQQPIFSSSDFPPATPLGLKTVEIHSSQALSKKQKKKQKQKQKSPAEDDQQLQLTSSQQLQPPRNASWNDLLVREQFSYSPPADLAQRQSRLLEGIRNRLVADEEFAQFARASADYLRGDLAAADFLAAIVGLVGPAAWKVLAPDLICTLPSIAKQRDLRQRLPDNVRCLFAVCDNCAQTVLPADLAEHRCLQIEE